MLTDSWFLFEELMSSLRPDTGVIQKAVFELGLVESFLGISGPLLAVSFVLILVL